MKCQDLFSLKKKFFFECLLLQILLGALRVKENRYIFWAKTLVGTGTLLR